MNICKRLARLEESLATKQTDSINEQWLLFASFMGVWDASILPPRIGYGDWGNLVVTQRETLTKGISLSLDDKRRNTKSWQRDSRARFGLHSAGLVTVQDGLCKPTFGAYAAFHNACFFMSSIPVAKEVLNLMESLAVERDEKRFVAESMFYEDGDSKGVIEDFETSTSSAMLPLITFGLVKTSSSGRGELIVQLLREWSNDVDLAIASFEPPRFESELINSMVDRYFSAFHAKRDKIETTRCEGSEVFIPWPVSHGLTNRS